MVRLDNVDRGILHELQLYARNRTAQQIADKVDVSASTVRNRITELEDDGVIEGYHPKIDYERAELPLQILFVCSAPPAERSDMVEKILDVRGVVDVRETLTGSRNLYVEAVGTDTGDTVRITEAMHDTGLTIESSEILRQRRVQPFNHFFSPIPTPTETSPTIDGTTSSTRCPTPAAGRYCERFTRGTRRCRWRNWRGRSRFGSHRRRRLPEPRRTRTGSRRPWYTITSRGWPTPD